MKFSQLFQFHFFSDSYLEVPAFLLCSLKEYLIKKFQLDFLCTFNLTFHDSHFFLLKLAKLSITGCKRFFFAILAFM